MRPEQPAVHHRLERQGGHASKSNEHGDEDRQLDQNGEYAGQGLDVLLLHEFRQLTRVLGHVVHVTALSCFRDLNGFKHRHGWDW